MRKPMESGVSNTWDATEVMIYCEVCAEQVELGNRPTTHFNKEGWNNVVVNFRARTGKQYDNGQMRNKWDMLKKEWKLWKDLKGKATGLGWNASHKTIDASDEWWEERLKIVPNAKKFRCAGITPELEEKLDVMFSEVVAMGDHCWAPSLGKRHSSKADERIVDDEEEVDPIATPISTSDFGSNTLWTYYYSESSDTARKARKRQNKGKSKIDKEKQALHINIGSLIEETRAVGLALRKTTQLAAQTQSYTIAEVVKELNRHPQIIGDKCLYDFATVFMMQRANREMFLCLDEDMRVEWLKNRYRCMIRSGMDCAVVG